MAASRATRQRQSSLSIEKVARQKRVAARAAAELVEGGMRLGLGTGTTVAFLLPAIAERSPADLICVATSPATEHAARKLGLTVLPLDEVDELDLAIDGADQIDPDGWLVKGGGGAHTREKIVASAARSFVVIASAEKAVPQLRPPVPLELVRFGAHHTLERIGSSRLRDVPESPDGGLIADYLGAVGEARALAATLGGIPGVIEHGLFEPELVSTILIAGDEGVQRRAGGKPPA